MDKPRPIMKVRVMSKNHFDKLLPRINVFDQTVEEQNCAFISIIGSDPEEKSYFNNDHPNVLRLVFDDITSEEKISMIKLGQSNRVLFCKEDAEKIIDFVDRNKDKYECFVHCAAGVSRSGAVGTFINDLCQYESFEAFARSNSQIKPNFYILAALRRVYNGMPLED